MKIFITGGTGNIGQYVTKALLKAGHEIVAYTRTPERIPQIGEQKNLTLVKGDLLNLGIMEKALHGCDVVIHIALGWGNTPVEMLDHDTRVTVFLLEKAEQAGVKNFIYTSSTAVFGRNQDGADETTFCTPDDLYGSTKAATEKYLIGFRQYYTGQGVRGAAVKIRRNIIRPGYTFSNPAFEGGASQSDTRFRDIARSVLKGENMEISEYDGTQFISSAQIAQVYLKLAESDLDEEIFLALGEPFTSWADIARMAIDLVPGTPSKVVPPAGEIRQAPVHVKVDKLKRVFGLSFDATTELREHVRWNIDRERKVLRGEKVHDVYHVW
ncbi:NAD(P)-dependent oxidoreductase [Treponema sp. TIM-1]|uniref:NAD-dependent epimerase/dehydratase family protein n=1 Tax=Treponema sp. TIM-1 TaxID=2898417 RepID=UPI00397F669C